jgi:hypothetical protein
MPLLAAAAGESLSSASCGNAECHSHDTSPSLFPPYILPLSLPAHGTSIASHSANRTPRHKPILLHRMYAGAAAARSATAVTRAAVVAGAAATAAPSVSLSSLTP